jgi:alkyl hydroperoxide reductase subunit AhpF
MLEANLKTQLKGYLERLTQPVEIIASVDDSDKSREMLELLNDIVSLSPLVTLDRRVTMTQVKPSFALRRAGQRAARALRGLPMGHEFTSLVLALLQAGGHPPKATRGARADPRARRRIQVRDLRVADLPELPGRGPGAELMAVVNPQIHHTMIDGALFQDEVERARSWRCPTVFLNGQPFGQGRMELEEIVAKLDTGAAARDAAARRQGALRRAGRRRRPGRRGGRDLRGAQGHSHRHRGRALGRPAAGYRGHRELHLGEGDRGPQARHRSRAAREALRRRRHESAARRGAGPGRAA